MTFVFSPVIEIVMIFEEGQTQQIFFPTQTYINCACYVYWKEIFYGF